MADPAATGEVRAAGAVLWRAGGYGLEVALVHRPRYDDWAFPKGKSEPGEHPLLTAVREVAEETGIRPVLGRPLTRTVYLAAGRPKRVDYWAATPASPWAEGLSLNGGAGSRAQAGFDAALPEFVPNDEIDKLEWLPVEAAAQRLSYERDVGLLHEFARVPAPTLPFIFLRHTSAVEKEGFPDAGLLRPLDEAGRADSWALADLLACFGPARLVSSAAARCVETLLPYVAAAGVPVAAEPAFAVDCAASGDAAAARLAALLADGLPTILCGHRENLPELYAQAVKHFGAEPPTDVALAKGSFRVLHVARPPGDGADGAGRATLVATERHDLAEL